MIKVVYISGPITGVANYRETFNRAENELIAAGYIALNPAGMSPPGLSNAQYIDFDLNMLRMADAVLFLPGWEESRGANLEHAYCEYTNRPRYYSIDELRGGPRRGATE